MVMNPLSLDNNYWTNIKVHNSDLEILYNHLLEIEVPQTVQELGTFLIKERISSEKKALESQVIAGNPIYLPKNRYQIQQKLVFPAMNWQKGHITAIRNGNNPDIPTFEVIQVEMESGERHQFASGIENHILNQPVSVNIDDPNLDIKFVHREFGSSIEKQISARLKENTDLVCIGRKWFPRALLVDVNMGYLNLAEALLEMEAGNPLTTKAILDQIDLPTDVNTKLTEFSLDLALQEDGRFDEVGPTGEIFWFLKRLEPESVQQIPADLRFTHFQLDKEKISDWLKALGSDINDELEEVSDPGPVTNEGSVSLIYPHWHSGTLPLCGAIQQFFPSAYESPRVRFLFIDGNSGQSFPGWVVRPSRYIFGLKEWYQSLGLMPGSIVHVIRGKKPGEVIIRAEKRRANREWIRTVLIGADGGVVFAMLKQLVTAIYDERMAIAIPDLPALERIWDQINRQKGSIEQNVLMMLRELSKLNPQGHVHFYELYAAVNLIRRCPPSVILSLLVDRPWANYLGDLYFRLNENFQEGHE
jgi:hypothetical protein